MRERQVKKKARQVRIEEDFRQRRLEELSERRVAADLKRSQAACELLDSRLVSALIIILYNIYSTLILLFFCDFCVLRISLFPTLSGSGLVVRLR